mmetsp:Transcript_10784/g.48975  ORF Transcript_10784/g.48975 Transcript_10784/m.48975 type:complete len:223 (+) Transcript_10784:94-762(+)
MAECLEGEARVVVLAARRDALILLSVEELGEDDGGDGEEDEAEELVVDAEDEAGAVAVEALVNLNSIERWKGKGGQRRELFDSDFCMILAGLVLSGRCTYHGEGGEGLRDEAGDRGGEHRLLGHGSLGDGGLGDGGLAGNLAGRGLCEGHGKDTGDRGQRGSHVARSNVGVRQQSPLMAKIDAREGRSQSQQRACSGPIAAVLTGGDRALHGEGHAGHFVCG